MIKATILGYEWFAWRPVRLGFFGNKGWIWLKKVVRVNTGCGHTFYFKP